MGCSEAFRSGGGLESGEGLSRIEDAQGSGMAHHGLRESRMGLRKLAVAECMTDEEFDNLKHGEKSLSSIQAISLSGRTARMGRAVEP